MSPDEIADRAAALRERIDAAARRAGRDPAGVTLVAVTKGHPAATVAAAYEAGLRDFGENRTDELRAKQRALDLPAARWHFIGHLQRRKARELPGHAALVHSVDRLALAEELSRRFVAAGEPLDILLQLNTSGEESKSGWGVSTREGAAAFEREIGALLALPALRVRGLMTMAPLVDDPEEARPTFATLRAWRERLAAAQPAHDFSQLSMGMSDDFEVAVEEGATLVRVGTALLGPRTG